MSRSSMFGTSQFDQVQQRFQAAHGGGGRPQPGGQFVRPTHQDTILHSAGLYPAIRGLEASATRQSHSAIQQDMRQQDIRQRMSFNAGKILLINQLVKKDSVIVPKKVMPKTPPVFYIKKKWNHINHDYRIWSNGEIHKRPNGLKVDRIGVEISQRRKGRVIYREYSLVAMLSVNEIGLVNFPANIKSFETKRYGGLQKSQWLKETGYKEYIGEGDHYLLPEAAAALIGLLNSLNQQGIHVRLGDMSTYNGSDPGQPKSPSSNFTHHAGHGHLGKRSGLDVDFRYIGKDGNSFQGKMADKNFSVKYNQILYEAAYKFGFDQQNTYQGNLKLLKGVKTSGGHLDHGHLGFMSTPSNVKIDVPDNDVPRRK